MSQQLTLFDLSSLSEKDKSSEKQYNTKPRLKRPIRNEVEITMLALDDLLPKDHLARDVWLYVVQLNLSTILKQIRSVEGNAGRPATDPAIYLALWLYA